MTTFPQDERALAIAVQANGYKRAADETAEHIRGLRIAAIFVENAPIDDTSMKMSRFDTVSALGAAGFLGPEHSLFSLRDIACTAVERALEAEQQIAQAALTTHDQLAATQT